MRNLIGGKQLSASCVRKLVLQVVLAFLTLTMAANVHAVPFIVDAKGNSSTGGTGLPTGIYLTVGDSFTVQVDPNDLWNAGDLPRWSNADGLIVLLFATDSDESGESPGTKIGEAFGFHTQNSLTAPFGSLVGEISGTYFLLGTNFSGSALNSGYLNLYYWDSYVFDNTQWISADVRIVPNPVPEPSTLLLLGCGLLGVASLTRRRKNQD